MKISSRGRVDPFIVMDVMKAAQMAEAQGDHIIHMEIGQPSTPAPLIARKALAHMMEDDPLGYTAATGLPRLRQKIAHFYKQRYGVSLSPNRVIVTTGSSAGFILAFTTLFDAGQKIGIAQPGYPSYRQIIKALNLQSVGVLSEAENGFQPTPKDICGHGLDGVLLASPANPTGTMLNRQDMSALIKTCHDENICFISDEIYHGLEYDKKSVSALEISDDVIVINSFSKYFSMTGWRIGWMVVPEHLVDAIERVSQNLFICPAHSSQITACAAFDADDELRRNIERYTQNRDLMVTGLPHAGFDHITPPDGGFFIYADVSKHTSDSVAFAAQILKEAKVAITPGVDFDPARGHTTVRFSYAGSTQDIKQGLARLRTFMASYKRS